VSPYVPGCTRPNVGGLSTAAADADVDPPPDKAVTAASSAVSALPNESVFRIAASICCRYSSTVSEYSSPLILAPQYPLGTPPAPSPPPPPPALTLTPPAPPPALPIVTAPPHPRLTVTPPAPVGGTPPRVPCVLWRSAGSWNLALSQQEGVEQPFWGQGLSSSDSRSGNLEPGASTRRRGARKGERGDSGCAGAAPEEGPRAWEERREGDKDVTRGRRGHPLRRKRRRRGEG